MKLDKKKKKVQILDKPVSILFLTDMFEKGMNPSLISFSSLSRMADWGLLVLVRQPVLQKNMGFKRNGTFKK